MAWPNVYNLDSSSFDNGAARKPSRPTLVLVHDAFHTNAHFTSLARELQEAGYRVLMPQLPSSSSTYQPNILEADVRTVHDTAKPEMEGSKNVVFIFHGYSGIPGPIAAERLNRYALTRPRTGFVVKTIFLAAMIASEGECYLDVLKPEWLTYEVCWQQAPAVHPLIHLLTYARTERWQSENHIGSSIKTAQPNKSERPWEC